jgi:hypothetical protein
MPKRITLSRKNQVFDEHKALLYYFYLYGNGLMLRQQLIALISKLSDKYDVEIEVALAQLIQNGLLSSSRAFSNTRHMVISLRKFALSIFTEKPSRDCHAVNLSPSSILYSTYKTELLLNKLDNGDLIRTPVVLRKNQAKDLHSWYGDLVETTQMYKLKKEDFHSTEPSCFSKDESFNFNHFLLSDFLLKDVYEHNGEKILQLYYLDLHCITIKKFYSLVGSVLKMFDRYTKTKLNRIEICMLFHNQAEMHAFKNGWNRNRFVNKMIEKRVNYTLVDCCHIYFKSLDLDKKYHIYRELV